MRLIDADALTEKLGIGKDCNECKHNEDEFFCNWKPDVVDICEAICTAPTVESKPNWIPCSERLPENNNTVLITHRGGVSVGWYNGRYWKRGASTKHRSIKTVTAWMPLPKPWEGADDVLDQ